MGGGPDLVDDHCHHEDEIEPKGPDDGQFAAVEVAAGDGVFFGADELVGLESGEGEGLVGGGRMNGLLFCHEADAPVSIERRAG